MSPFPFVTASRGIGKDVVLRYIDESGRENSTILEQHATKLPDPDAWPPLPSWTGKYVDNLQNTISNYSQHPEEKTVRADECQESFDLITRNAERIGMRVNPSKSKLLILCVAPSTYSNISCFIHAGTEKIEGSNSLTILGFRFGRRPMVRENMELIREKFVSRSWMVRHLKAVGVPALDIIKV